MALVNYTDEYSKLKKIALYKPTRDEIFQGDPTEVMYISRPDPEKVFSEFNGIVKAFEDLGVEVVILHDDTKKLPNTPNMIYLRDVATIINRTIIPANMKFKIRHEEPNKFLKLLAKKDPAYKDAVKPVLKNETMEGADILLLSHNQICTYTGYRTSSDAISAIAKDLHIEAVDIQANINKIPQHLLGGIHILSENLMTRRSAYCKTNIGTHKAIDFEENSEVRLKFSLNIVTINLKVVLMPSGCPITQKKLEENDIICHTVNIDEIHKMGGGLACMTLPLLRSSS